MSTVGTSSPSSTSTATSTSGAEERPPHGQQDSETMFEEKRPSASSSGLYARIAEGSKSEGVPPTIPGVIPPNDHPIRTLVLCFDGTEGQ
jgi:hypothetical protein